MGVEVHASDRKIQMREDSITMAEEKLKILYLMKILLDETDKDHILNASELCDRMQARYSLPCNRKTIYGDVERLQTFGIKVEQVKGDRQGYYVADREFSLPELKLLVDAVQSSKFITKTGSEELIRKLEKLTSWENARKLRRQVFIINRTKTLNEAALECVDLIHEAMSDNRQIRFHYCDWNVRKEFVPRRNGMIYEISPWALTWDDENYYLVGHEERTDMIKHYRVDKMQDMEISEKERAGQEKFRNFDLAAFSRKTFGMFGGQDTNVTLSCENRLIGVVLDRFGRDIMIMPKADGTFTAHVVVTVSPQFFGWVTGIGEGMRIAGPLSVQKEYREYLSKILAGY